MNFFHLKMFCMNFSHEMTFIMKFIHQIELYWHVHYDLRKADVKFFC